MSGRILLSLCAAALLLGGCTSTQKRLSAKEYYTRASAAFAKEDFGTAADQYRELLDQYPLNPYAEESQLKVAYAYYLDKKYTEAIASFGDFERTYPTSSHLPFVEYYRGLCYLEQMRSIDRDQSVTEKAHGHFRAVADRYVESPFAPLAEEKIKVCREALAAHELYIIEFYDRNDSIFAAIVRLRALLEKYPDTEVATAGLTRLNSLLNEGGEKELAALAAKALELRLAATPPTQQPVVASVATNGNDPLLKLIAEIKKREDLARQKAPATPAPPPAAPKESLPGEGIGEEEE
ncbi:MAG: outer membrane protein assembly factor BamD [Candidatus Binatia bacterium]